MRSKTYGPPDSLEAIEREPTFEDELDSAAKFMRTRLEWATKVPTPFSGILFSVQFVGALAGWLEQCSRDRRRELE